MLINVKDTQEILSEINVYNKYVRHLKNKNRRENWHELVTRDMDMHIKKFPNLESEIRDAFSYVYDKKILPSMRSLQFAGKPIEVNNARLYNCSFANVDNYRVFGELMFLLLAGVGTGFSVQKNHIEKLPVIRKPHKTKRFLIADSIEGWADAVNHLVKAYFRGTAKPIFDYRDIRPKGEKLITSGGKAPGSAPLRICLDRIDSILSEKNEGDKLRTIEAYDMICHMADAVLAGGIRRAATIALFSFNDLDMLHAKHGNWWELNPQRGRANNSAVILRHKITEEEFKDFWKIVELSKSGEPGIFFTNDENWGMNPSLRAGTKVLTQDGIFPIEQLENKEFIVPNLDGTWSEASCWKSGSNVPLWKLTFDNGVEYYASPEHKWPIYVNGRYVKCKSEELKVGDLLPINVFNRDKLFNGTKGDYNTGLLIGWLYGDGCLTERSDTGKYVASFVVSKSETEVLDILLKTINSIDGVDHNPTIRESTIEFQVGNSKFIDYIMNEFKVSKKEDGIPSNLWTEWSDDMIRGFVDGLFSSDGSVPKDSHGITLVSSKTKLIHDVQELLGFYGIKSNILYKQYKNASFPNGKSYNKTYETYTLRTTLKGRIQFGNLFKLSVKSKQDKLLNVSISKNKDTISQNFMVLKNIELTNLREDVWDIGVKDSTHCFHLSTVTTGNCGEIGLRSNQFCNLVEVNVSNVVSQDDLNERVKRASFIATLQASYTDFHFLRDIWKETTEKEALIGVSMTGIADGEVFNYSIKEGAEVVKNENERVAGLIGINKAYRCTTVKPSGSSSIVLKTSSGIHARHSKYYWRRMRIGKNENLYTYLVINAPELLEDDMMNPSLGIIKIAVKSPEHSITRDESPIHLLERIKKVYSEWIKTGHRKGNNTNNVSATVSIKDNEWDVVGDWMWKNKDYYSGLSVLPFDNHTYVQTPYEDCTEQDYNEFLDKIKDLKIDLDDVVELEDNTDLQGEVACGGSGCEVK